MRIRHFALAAALILGTVQAASAKDSWLGAWGFAVVPPPPGIATPVAPPAIVPLAPLPEAAAAQPPLVENPGNIPVATLNSDPADVTIRQLVRVSAAGKRIRLRFTNEGGSDVLTVGAVHVGLAGPDGSVLPGSDRTVTFDGHQAITIPAGAPLLTDPVDLPVKALDRLVISTYLPGTAARTGHTLLQYMAGTAGNQAGATQLPGQKLARLTALVSEVDVDATTATGVIVCLGDSITDGATSTANAFRSYPDRLAERLAPAGKWAVVNVGIGGNKLLRYGTGPNALARLDRDVLSVPGVKAIILLEGINDIGQGFKTTGVQDPVSLEALIAADKQIIQRAHDHGIKVIGALLTPYQGAGYASPAGEAVRTALNNWIRTGGAFDGVVDFAAA
ncbi:MAG TPA: GDSL-type esterase/lipase family protein, partial [Rhizomicrobium sp.]|nr:GDSL-type esterase/lipase family protein [Rhizomicrobium sp.]